MKFITAVLPLLLTLNAPMAVEAREVRGNNWMKEQTTQVAEPIEDITEYQVASIQALAGGPEGYKAMMQWAAVRLPKEKVQAFDAVIETGDMVKIFNAVHNLVPVYVADMEADNAMTQKQLVAKWSF